MWMCAFTLLPCICNRIIIIIMMIIISSSSIITIIMSKCFSCTSKFTYLHPNSKAILVQRAIHENLRVLPPMPHATPPPRNETLTRPYWEIMAVNSPLQRPSFLAGKPWAPKQLLPDHLSIPGADGIWSSPHLPGLGIATVLESGWRSCWSTSSRKHRASGSEKLP